MPDLTINRDRRVADVETVFDPEPGQPVQPAVRHRHRSAHRRQRRQRPSRRSSGPTCGPFVVRNIFTDFKRHDLGPNFHEINYDGTLRTEFLTTALWGVGNTAPYGHDGRSMNLKDVILRHGGEAQAARDDFAQLGLEPTSGT